jgi:hypothetical protein
MSSCAFVSVLVRACVPLHFISLSHLKPYAMCWPEQVQALWDEYQTSLVEKVQEVYQSQLTDHLTKAKQARHKAQIVRFTEPTHALLFVFISFFLLLASFSAVGRRCCCLCCAFAPLASLASLGCCCSRLTRSRSTSSVGAPVVRVAKRYVATNRTHSVRQRCRAHFRGLGHCEKGGCDGCSCELEWLVVVVVFRLALLMLWCRSSR